MRSFLASSAAFAAETPPKILDAIPAAAPMAAATHSLRDGAKQLPIPKG